MADLSDLFEMSRPFEPTDSAWRTIERRAARRQRNRRVGSAALGLGMFLGAMIGLLMAFNRTVPVFGPRGRAVAALPGPAARGRGSALTTTGLGSPRAGSTADHAATVSGVGGGAVLVDLHDEHRQIVDARVGAASQTGGRGGGEAGPAGSGPADSGPGSGPAGTPGHGTGHEPVQGGPGSVGGSGGGSGSGSSGGSSGGCGGGSAVHGPTHVRGPRACEPRGGCNLS
jgi:hypothetical protein